MSGHSKWNNIKNKKAKGDAARSKIFTKIGREIAVAVKAGGADPNTNSKLYDVVQKAKANNMPNDNITRSIKKASGELSAVDYVEMTYEGYGIGGSAVIVECLTDNKNRTAGDVRCAFDKNGGSLGQTNCVSYMFNRTGVVVAENTVGLDEDSAFELAIESGAEDVTVEDGMVEMTCEPSALASVRDAVVAKGLNLVSAEMSWLPQTMVSLEGDNLVKFRRMLDTLEDNDDVQNVYHNVALPDDEE
ncbi:MAG TPA: YebC/PmpR family DNA-binding transcriptional regulator [Candidatus Fimimonas merdipullorum]|uniref:Probable transcriptional regulatory protein IAC72_00880 n=1 Tax=Candidatus Fimimonas merdipullorum TaxID=2840822 RepID=A0A9D1MWQ8_9BACT|nr:YebC/PmpR family DNA-binding transcriptional regulator [Candidatus Fimimonas merdipullorum]